MCYQPLKCYNHYRFSKNNYQEKKQFRHYLTGNLIIPKDHRRMIRQLIQLRSIHQERSIILDPSLHY